MNIHESESTITGRKCVFETVPLTSLQRFRVWKAGVLRAIAEEPPKTRTRTVEVFPGDPRLDDKSVMKMDIVMHSVSFGKISDMANIAIRHGADGSRQSRET